MRKHSLAPAISLFIIAVILLSLGCLLIVKNSMTLQLMNAGESLFDKDGNKLNLNPITLHLNVFCGVLLALVGLGCLVFGVVSLIRTIKINKAVARKAAEEREEVTKLNLCKAYDDKTFLQFDKGEASFNRFMRTLIDIPKKLWNVCKKIGQFFKKAALSIANEVKDIWTTFVNGDWKTKLSYLVMGFGSIARGQVLRGILFLLMEVVFIGYMILYGGSYLYLLGSLGRADHAPYNVAVKGRGGRTSYQLITANDDPNVDNSFKILLYGVLTLFFIVAFIYTWRVNVKQNKLAEQILKKGKKLKSDKDDLRSLVDDQFHKTLLALPMLGIVLFTVMPIVFMILVAFTNYSSVNDGIQSLFGWVGFKNFGTMLSWEGGGNSYAATFGEVLLWTLIWAFFATFTNYFLGIAVALMINKKGIQFKKVWRTVLIMTIAIPQFISLLYVSSMFAEDGLINGILQSMHVTHPGIAVKFWNNALDPWLARAMVIIINIWIGIPYLMLIATGILMNIPADLYESAKIDGASGWKQFSKITLPYMLFITGPYLLTSFTGNMNNFNVIYLLTGGAPNNIDASIPTPPGKTDLLITWLFKITQSGAAADGRQYYLASVIGILVFLVVSVISLIVYGLLPSVKNEEDFQ